MGSIPEAGPWLARGAIPAKCDRRNFGIFDAITRLPARTVGSIDPDPHGTEKGVTPRTVAEIQQYRLNRNNPATARLGEISHDVQAFTATSYWLIEA